MSAGHDLGAFLRACRAGTEPESVGLTPGPGRRVRGLRREEVAQLAGLSVDYYTRLEQGRHTSPSESVVEALVAAMDLDAAAAAHLRDLARPPRRGAEKPSVQRVRPAVHQLLGSLTEHPALVLGRRTDVLASNRLAAELMTDFDALPARRRNYVRWLLLDPAAREVFPDWRTVSAQAVGTLRLDAGRHPADALLEQLVGELTLNSEEFTRWWTERNVHQRTHGRKRFHHHLVGELALDFEALSLPGDADQTLFVYSAESGSASHERLMVLASWVAESPAHGRRPPRTGLAAHGRGAGPGAGPGADAAGG
ncbi:helix-turn-helix transcriptional regulator [Kineococcus indalonis]|uniref:helix-turn-helix transcriptional regulator n=1 Tax=Kineococcus indalonis TaxID=2696566 RepID=UPI001411FA2F|nr:helix-turn-helix transcriptional regulator [Kineococcus indalonis]NAZ85427.1 helix-turn-helix domain-containing protein [Kineococcus indalonis]